MTINFYAFMKKRVENSSENFINDVSNDQCFILNDNTIKIKNTNITVLKYLDYGATSIIFKAINKTTNTDFVLKIMLLSDNEISILNKSSKLVKDNITPHLIILYKNILCPRIDKNNFVNYKDNDLNNLTDNYLLNHNFSLLIMELFDDNLLNLIFRNKERYNISNEKRLHIEAQVFLSILTFHDKLKYIHGDAQYKNFFYKEININEEIDEYFHYKVYDIDIYVKNVGFLIVLGDYGFSKQIPKQNTEEELLKDYLEFLNHHPPNKEVKNERDYLFYLLYYNKSMFKTQLIYGEIALNAEPYYIFSNKNSKRERNDKKNDERNIKKKRIAGGNIFIGPRGGKYKLLK